MFTAIWHIFLPGDRRLARLERNLRANLEHLSVWLASVLGVLRKPERIQLEGESDGGTSMAMTFNLRFSWPDNIEEELDTWADTPTGYDAGHVRVALGTGLKRPAGDQREGVYGEFDAPMIGLERPVGAPCLMTRCRANAATAIGCPPSASAGSSRMGCSMTMVTISREAIPLRPGQGSSLPPGRPGLYPSKG